MFLMFFILGVNVFTPINEWFIVKLLLQFQPWISKYYAIGAWQANSVYNITYITAFRDYYSYKHDLCSVLESTFSSPIICSHSLRPRAHDQVSINAQTDVFTSVEYFQHVQNSMSGCEPTSCSFTLTRNTGHDFQWVAGQNGSGQNGTDKMVWT